MFCKKCGVSITKCRCGFEDWEINKLSDEEKDKARRELEELLSLELD